MLMATILVTGSSSGFGMLTALEFARRGHTVFASMRDPLKAGRLGAEAEAAGLAVEVLQLDVTDRASVEAAVGAVLERTGRLDVVVNNAGIFNVGPVEAHDDDEIRAAFDTNVIGVVRVIRAALPAMRAQRAGTIVVIGSIAGRVAWPPVGIYAATKGALETLCDTLHYELHPFGIRVVLVEPGHFATGLSARLARGYTKDSPYRGIARAFTAFPLAGRAPGDPRRVAELVVEAAEAEHPRRRYVVGEDAEYWCGLRERLTDDDFERVVRSAVDFWE
jgi:NAD(P)-dependent dehydrogenase (short-subunit alcohol dehydrogenase family)